MGDSTETLILRKENDVAGVDSSKSPDRLQSLGNLGIDRIERQMDKSSGDRRDQFLELHAVTQLRHVAEAPYPTDGLSVQPLRDRVTFENPAVLELENIETLRLRARVELSDFSKKLLRLPQL